MDGNMRRNAIIGAVALLLAVVGVGLSVWLTARAHRNVCLNNLRQIDAASDSWGAVVNGKRGDPVDANAISQYMKGGTLPVCPSGGKYTVPPLGQNVTCSMHGDMLGPDDFPHKWEDGYPEAMEKWLKEHGHE